MANRFTDSRKWDDPWFMELQPHYKILWIYLLDKCDHAGIYKHNPRLASFTIGYDYDWKEVREVLKTRIVETKKGNWFIPKFIQFQYGTLNPENRVHKSAIDRLEKEGAYKGHQSPLNGAKDKDKDKDKNKDSIYKSIKSKTDNQVSKSIIVNKDIYTDRFEQIWSAYPNKDGKKLALKHFIATVKTDADWKNIQKALKNYTKSERVKKGFIKNGSTWFNNWQDWIEPPDGRGTEYAKVG